MKILHTGDWHIGKLVHGIHMTEDQRYLLKQLLALIETEKPDVVLIAGDVYDRSVPPVEAVELLDEVLTGIVVGLSTKAIVIAGNHDSPDRLGFGSQLLREKGLYISGSLQKNFDPICLMDSYGAVDFYPIPFMEPALVSALYGEEAIKSHDQAMSAIIHELTKSMDKTKRNICIAHGFVMGTETLETSESERPLSIGGSEYISVDHFKDFDYVALGHLHGPQRVGREEVRYSGSLMKYSFSEVIQKKSVTVIELGPKGQVDVRLKSLVPLRDMRVIKGALDQLLDKAVYGGTPTEDYIMAIVTDRGELVDTMSKLRAVYPNILRMEREVFDREAGSEQYAAGKEFAQMHPLELFREFYENTSGEDFTEEKKHLMETIFEDVLEKGRKV